MPNNKRSQKLLKIGFALTFLHGLQFALLIYVLSDYLSMYIDNRYISVFYLVSSLVSLYISSSYHRLLKYYHNYGTSIIITSILMFALLVMGLADNPWLICFYSAVYLIINNSLLYIALNLYVDEWAIPEGMGAIRGINLTLSSISLVLGLLLSRVLLSIDISQYKFLSYFNSKFAILIIFDLLLVYIMNSIIRHYYANLTEPKYHGGNIWNMIRSIHRNRDIYGVFMAQLSLQTFISIMVAYFVTYLLKFNYVNMQDYVGYIMPIALLPFVLLPYKVGELCDRKLGEKEFIILGTLIMSISLIFIPILSHYNNKLLDTNYNNYLANNRLSEIAISGHIIPVGVQPILDNINHNVYVQIVMSWAALLLLGRIGATLVDTASNTYFYKRINNADNDAIALFTNMTSVGALFAALLAYMSYYIDDIFNINYTLFIMGALFLVLTLNYTFRIRDTK